MFAAVHSLLATQRSKQFFSRGRQGEPRCYRLIYNLTSLVMFGWVMAAYRQSPLLYAVPGIWRWLLHAAQVMVAAVIFLCLRQTGTGVFLGLQQLRSEAQQTQRLATDGWYARVRHPLYLFSTLFLVLNPVMTTQWALLTVFSVIYFIAGGLIEERRLLREFGEDYRNYRMRVPFMVPKFKSGKSTHL